MSLTRFNVHNVRNIVCAQIELNPRFNVFYGVNGSGKTSILESLYLLSSGHSFRTREISPLIRQGEDSLTVFSRTDSLESLSIQKKLTGPTLVKLNKQAKRCSSELAFFLPSQVFYQDIFTVMDAGPSVRRSLFDWGLFYFNSSFHLLWKDYCRVLKQRNVLLRQKAKRSQFVPWNDLLVQLSVQIECIRASYFLQWSKVFQETLSQLTNFVCEIDYFKGWDKKLTGKSLATILDEQLDSDQLRQYTQSGAHHADLLFMTFKSGKAKLTLSRGQQKIVLIALKLSQAQLLNKPCLYLFDDVIAELDSKHLQRLLTFLQTIPGQFVFTALTEKVFELSDIDKQTSYFSLINGQVFAVSRETAEPL